MEPIFASVSSAQVGGGGTFRVPFAGSRFMLHKGAWRMPNVLWGVAEQRLSHEKPSRRVP